MQPPELPDISDSVSITASEITDISLVYSGQTMPAPPSSLPRGSSVYTESPRLVPQDSVSQQLGHTRDFDDEEARLQQEIAELEKRQRILALQRKKQDLIRSIESGL
jgi:hypothetical protein